MCTLRCVHTKFVKVMFSQVFVCLRGGGGGGSVQGGGSLSGGVSVKGVSVLWVLCPGVSLSRGVSVRVVSVWGISVRRPPLR